MRVMVVEPGPGFSVQDVNNGIVAGLRANGCTVGNYNLHDRLQWFHLAHIRRDDTGEWEKSFSYEHALALAVNGIYAEAYKYLPDVAIIVSGFYAYPKLYETLRARGTRVVLWCTESPYEDSRQLGDAALADLVILNDPTNLPQFRAVQPNTYYLGHSYDPAIHQPRPANPEYASDFFWVGTGYPSRCDFFEQVDWTGIGTALGGNWQHLTPDSPILPFLIHDQDVCMSNADAADWYASTKASANIYRREFGDGTEWRDPDAGWAMGPREVEMAAIGCFYLTEERGENREVLPMVPTFDGTGDFEEKLRWWLTHDTERGEVAVKAQAAIADRTFEATTARMLQLLEH